MSRAEFMLSVGPFNFELPEHFLSPSENGDVQRRGVEPKSCASRIGDLFLTSALVLLIVGKDAYDSAAATTRHHSH